VCPAFAAFEPLWVNRVSTRSRGRSRSRSSNRGKGGGGKGKGKGGGRRGKGKVDVYPALPPHKMEVKRYTKGHVYDGTLN